MLHSTGYPRSVLELLLADDKQVDRHEHALQGTIEPNHLSTVRQLARTAVPSTRQTSAGLVRPSRISERACMKSGDIPLSIAIR